MFPLQVYEKVHATFVYFPSKYVPKATQIMLTEDTKWEKLDEAIRVRKTKVENSSGVCFPLYGHGFCLLIREKISAQDRFVRQLPTTHLVSTNNWVNN